LAGTGLITPALVECVPNFSEGRDDRVLSQIADSILAAPGVRLLDHSADADHHRSVFTFAGPPEEVMTAALSAAAVAVEHVDLNRHTGVHPRIGAVDVVPFVPLAGASMEECVRLARDFGQELFRRFRVPVFLYEQAAIEPERRNLEQVRRIARDGARPDIGDGRHPTAGACAVGARDFLIAWNIWLETPDLAIARQIARAVRFSSGGFPGVKALGLPLVSSGMVQVSINTTDFRVTPLHLVFQVVCAMAAQAGVRVLGSELIGMIPQTALDLSAGHDLRWLNLSPARVLEEVAAK
jgi:glutamate formiminotransferase